MNKQPMNRRDFFRWTATAGAATVVAGVVLGQTACGGKGDGGLNCDDNSGLALADKQTRTVNKYVEKSVTKGKSCTNCQLFKPPATAGTCGTCTVVKGTINPDGYCLLWAEKKA